jgi:hypothetical protein
MALIYYLCLCLPATLLVLVYYHLRSRGAAFVFTVTVRLLFSRYLKSFSVNRITILPITFDDLQITTNSSRNRPEISVSWKSLKLQIDFQRIRKKFDYYWNICQAAEAAAEAPIKESSLKKFICITIEDFSVSSPNLRFKDILNPSSTAFSFPVVSPEDIAGLDSVESWRASVKRRFLAVPVLFSKVLTTACLQSLFDLFLLQFDKFDVNFDLPTHESSIKVSAERCIFYTRGKNDIDSLSSDPPVRSTSVDGLGLLLAVDMTRGKLAITHGGVLAFDYAGHFYRFSIDAHVPSRHMTVSFRSIKTKCQKPGIDADSSLLDTEKESVVQRDCVDVRVQPFLEFYTRFQSAEDDAMELKLAKGLSATGRMRTISLFIEALRVNITDFRSSNSKNILVDEVFFGIRNFKVDGSTGERLGGSDWHGGIGIFTDLFDSREMSAFHERKRISVNFDKELTISASRIEWVTDKPPPISSPSQDHRVQSLSSTQGSGNVGNKRGSGGSRRRSSTSSSISDGIAEVAIYSLVSATKSMRVMNCGDYIDIETLKGTVKSVQLERLSAETLNWQLIAQAISESLPTSRFSHVKNSELEAHIENLLFSIAPEDIDSSSSSSSSSGSTRHHDTHLREIDRLVSFQFAGLTCRKESTANQISSKYFAHSDLLEVDASLLATSLQAEYNFKVDFVDDTEEHPIGTKGTGQKRDEGGFQTSFNMSRDSSVTSLSRCPDRVGAVYTFAPFELIAQSSGPSKMQIEAIKAENFSIDLMSSSALGALIDRSSSSSSNRGCREAFATGSDNTVFRSEFLRSSLDSIWKPVPGQASGSDILCDMGDTAVHPSAAGMLKLSLTNQMVRGTIDGVTGALNRIKAMKVKNILEETKPPRFFNGEMHTNSRGRLDRNKEKEKNKEELEPQIPSKAVLTVKCSHLRANLLIAAERTASIASPSGSSSPLPSSPHRPSPASDSPQRGSTATSDFGSKVPRSCVTHCEELTMCMEFHTFEYESSVLETKYSWDHGSAVMNDFSEKVFLSSTGFSYHTRRPPVNVPYAYSGSVDSAKTSSTPQPFDIESGARFGQNHEREGDGIGPEIPGVRYTTVEMVDLEIGMSPHMMLGVAVDSLQAQYDAYKSAKENRVLRKELSSPSLHRTTVTTDYSEGIGCERERERERSFIYNPATDTFEFEDLDSTEYEAPVDTFDYGNAGVKRGDQERAMEEQSKRVPSVLAISMGIYRFTLDTVHEDKYIPSFAVLECTNLKVKIDATKEESAVYDEIAALDFGPEDPPIILTPSASKFSNNGSTSTGKRGTGSDKKRGKKEKKAANAMKRNFLQYKHIGGIVTVSQDRMVMRFICQKEAYMDTTKWRMTGPIYMASAVVFDGAIRTFDEDITLADSSHLPSLLVGPRTTKSREPSMSPLQDFFNEPYDVTPTSHSPKGSPNSRHGHGHGLFCDINSTDGSYGSAMRPYSPRVRLVGKSDCTYVPALRRRSVCVATVLRSTAPTKIYWDATASAATLDMWLDDNTREYMDSFNSSLVRLTLYTVHCMYCKMHTKHTPNCTFYPFHVLW